MVAAVLFVPGTQAALNKPLPFAATAPFMGDLSDANGVTVTSAAVQLSAPQVQGTIGLLQSSGLTISGLTKVCTQEGNANPSCITGDLAIQVRAGSSVALCFPSAIGASFQADHALALFVDFSSEDDLNTLPVSPSLVAPSIAGLVSLFALPTLDEDTLVGSPCTSSAVIVGLDNDATFMIHDAGTQIDEVGGKTSRIAFAGAPAITPTQTEFVVVPFGNSAQASFSPAKNAAADAGLNGTRLSNLIAILDQSHSASTTQRDTSIADSLGQIPESLRRLLNGAYLQIDSQAVGAELDPAGLTFARITTLTATVQNGEVHYEGRALLAASNGHIDHTHKLIGVGIFSLPLIGLFLWIIGIGVWITRLSLHPDKHSRWDSVRWVGWIASPLVFILVFILADREVYNLLGASFFTGTSGRTQAIYFLLDVSFLGILGFVAASPLRLLFRNSLLLARQGTFMNLSGSVAMLLSYFIASTYFRDYLDVVFRQVIGKLA